MNRIIKIIFFLVLSHFLLNLNTAMGQEKIKIGLLIPMTGLDKELGESIIKAVRLAVKDIDSDLIEIIPKDTNTKPEKTLKSALELKLPFSAVPSRKISISFSDITLFKN